MLACFHNAIVERVIRALPGAPGRSARAARLLSHGPRLPKRSAGLVGLLGVAILAVSCTNASALIVNVNGSAVSYEAVRGAAGAVKRPSARKRPTTRKAPVKRTPVEYHGGPVMPSNTNYALYWDPTGASEYPAGYESGLNRYFEDLAHDSGGVENIDSVLTQYKDEAGEFANYSSHFGGALIDSDPYPANGCSAAPVCLTDEQLRAEIKAYVEAHKLPTDLQHEYFVLTPPGVEGCLEAAGHSCSDGAKDPAYCAYHSFISTGTGVIIYADDPYVDGLNCDYGEEHPNNNASDATIGGGLAHEHSESVTDPELNAWYDSKKLEVADKCRTFIEATEYGSALGKAPDGSKYNQVINDDLYYYQQVWSNEADACQQRRSAPLPTVTAVTPKRGPGSGETTVTISGTNFTSPATVKFGEAPGTKVTVNSSSSITVVSPAHAAGTVDVIVTTSAGPSATSKKDHFIYKK